MIITQRNGKDGSAWLDKWWIPLNWCCQMTRDELVFKNIGIFLSIYRLITDNMTFISFSYLNDILKLEPCF